MEKNSRNNAQVRPHFGQERADRESAQVRPHFGQERADRRPSLSPTRLSEGKLVIGPEGCLVTIEDYFENLKSGENQWVGKLWSFLKKRSQ